MKRNYSKYFGTYLPNRFTIGTFVALTEDDTDFVIDAEALERLEEYPDLEAFLDDVASLVTLEDHRTPRYYRGE